MILLTGGHGFLGRRFQKNLGYDNFFTFKTEEIDLRREDSVCNLLEYYPFGIDYIYHLASKTKAGDWCLYNTATQFIDNQLINTNIIKYWLEKKCKIIGIGTSCSYPNSVERVEENYLDGLPEESLETYAFTKRMLYVGFKSVNKQYNLKYIYYIPPTLYGTDFSEKDSHFIYDLIRKIYNAKLTGDGVILWGDGNQRRQLLYVDDFINIIEDTKDKFNNDIINISDNKDCSIKEYAKIICDIFDYDYGLIKYDNTKYVGMKENKIVNSKIEYDFTDIRDGLKKTADYYVNLFNKKM